MPNHEVRTRKVEANGASFYVEESGAGTPVLLVHGGSASSAMYHDAAKLMASEFHVVTFDDRGHGRSTNPSGELNYALTADDAAALIGAST